MSEIQGRRVAMVNMRRVADNGCDGTHINGEERLKKEKLLKDKYLKKALGELLIRAKYLWYTEYKM